MLKICVIVPCYNEGQRILENEYISFLNNHANFHLLFIDDGSTDNTFNVLSKLEKKHEKISTLRLNENLGKAEAIRSGFNKIVNDNYDLIGYLDADLAIPFSEMLRLQEKINDGYHFAFSSKKPTKDSELEIKFKRYFVGRVLSFMVSKSLKLKIYDTQCGSKLMQSDLASIAFKSSFFSSWLFDVEIIWRIIINNGRSFFKERAIEVPVKKLIDRGSSRIKLSDLFSLPFEFFKIHSHYKKKLKAN